MRRKPWGLLLELAVTAAVIWGMDPANQPIGPRLWYGLSRTCYRTAHRLGQLGMYAENHYRKEIQP